MACTLGARRGSVPTTVCPVCRPEYAHCVMCEAEGQTKHAVVVDHMIPPKGDRTLFWDSANNSQGLYKSHQSRDKQAEERRFTKSRRIGIDGYPFE